MTLTAELLTPSSISCLVNSDETMTELKHVVSRESLQQTVKCSRINHYLSDIMIN
jgi:HSP90 family molecular chaperone